MSIISEALNQIFESYKDSADVDIIKINVLVNDDLHEDVLPSTPSKLNDQLVEEWFDFAMSVENIIEHFGDIVNIDVSKNPDSISEYIDFYPYDKEGNQKQYLIDLRLSNHKQSDIGRQVRKRKVGKLDKQWKPLIITVNSETFSSYSAALNYLRKKLADDLMNG